MQREEQDRDLADFGVRFDVMSSEQAIYDAGRVERALALLGERGLTYESDGALWLRTTEFGDDKDRVLRKSDGSLTYLVPDIAYHIDKHERGFDRAIDVWGADHHGYIPRMRAVLAALGYPADFFDVELVQLVKVMRGGEEVKMSKRSGRVRHPARPGRRGRGRRRALLLPGPEGRRARSTSTSSSPRSRPTRTRSSTSRWRTPG